MRILSEQANSKLRIAPVDLSDPNVTDEEYMAYILELRGNRGKSVRKATSKDGSSTSKTKKPPKSTKSLEIDDDLEIA
jgi:hypothetical protein